MDKKRVVLGGMQYAKVLKSVLEHKGYEVILVNNGSEVSKSIKLNPPPNAYIIDADLPTWFNSGVSAMTMICRTYAIPVVYIVESGKRCPVEIRREDEKGMVIRSDSTLSGFEFDKILTTLADLIELHDRTIPFIDWD